MNIILFICTLCFFEASLQFSLDYNESGSGISFEIQAPDENSIEFHQSIENSNSGNGVIDNDQVFCIWEDVHVRDEMATKLGTEICRFSLVRLL